MYANGSCENIFEPLKDVFKYFGKPVIDAPTYVQKTESDQVMKAEKPVESEKQAW